MSRPDTPSPNTPDISATRLLEALAEVYADCAQTPLELATNALCDLRHLCDAQGFAFAQLDRDGHLLYCLELGRAKP